MSAVYAVVAFCGTGSLTLWDRESEAREYLALLTHCCRSCSGMHKIIRMGEVIA